jgi:hypothetical protein
MMKHAGQVWYTILKNKRLIEVYKLAAMLCSRRSRQTFSSSKKFLSTLLTAANENLQPKTHPQ